MPGLQIGHDAQWAIKQHSGAWNAAPMLLGASMGFRANSDTIDPNSALIASQGVFANLYKRDHQAVPGSKMPAGDIELDFYYQCFGAGAFLAAVHGQDTVTTPVTNVKLHEMAPQNSHKAKYFTLGEFSPDRVREYNTAKILGYKLHFEQGARAAVLTPHIASADEHFNTGVADVAFVVASVTISVVALTVLAQALTDFNPSPFTMTKTGTTTALNVTLVALDEYGDTYTRTFTETDFVANLFTDTKYIRRVISVTVNSFTGAAAVSCGLSRGINQPAAASSVTEEAARDLVTFNQMQVFICPQGQAADFGATDVIAVTMFDIEHDLSMDSDRVTTEQRRLISEPASGGKDLARVAIGFTVAAEDDTMFRYLWANHAKNPWRMKVVLTGPPIGATNQPNQYIAFLNGIKLEKGSGNLKGPGVRTIDFSGEARGVGTLPTGFPTGAITPIFTRLFNAYATQYLT